jgi:tyrosyl-tRNA synthetase
MKTSPEERSAQKKLAEEVTRFVHGEQALEQALKVTQALFLGDFHDLDASGLKMLSKTLDHITLSEPKLVIDALVETNLASSKREARTFNQSGAVMINDQKVDQLEQMITQEDALFNQFTVIRRGKKKYAMIIYRP